LFMHNEGYSTMCGHGIIAVTKVVIETGMLPMSEPETQIEIDTPAGPVTAWARVRNGTVESVRFKNVSSYAYTINQTVEVPEFGLIPYDIGFGGAYYAYVSVSEVGLKTTPTHYSKLIHAGKQIKQAIMTSMPIDHPSEPDLGFLYGTIFTGPAESTNAHSRHVCVFADGEVDRSPTGTGVSGRLAVLHEKGLLGVGECIRIESIIGSSFTGTIVQTSTNGVKESNSIVPEIEGRAFITGRHEFILDPMDPLKNGFLLR
ncbi:MAG: proline racemase, partial [Rhodothermaceae bacterium]|nr:proline racemase [Rhodothermaceae bacterium]